MVGFFEEKEGALLIHLPLVRKKPRWLLKFATSSMIPVETVIMFHESTKS